MYKELLLDLNEIELDRNNPRYSTYDEDKNDMVNFMVKVHLRDMFELVRDILMQMSLNPLDKIGVFLENGSYVVGDGNRRVCALKIIFSNKEDLDTEFQKLLNENISRVEQVRREFKKIPVVDLVNRDNASKWLERKHTNNGGYTSRSWNTFERQLHRKNERAIFVRDVMSSYNVPRRDYVEIVKWATWDRIFTSRLLRRYFGLEIKNKEIKISSEKDFQQKVNALISLIKSRDLGFYKSFINQEQQREAIKIMDAQLKNESLIKSSDLLRHEDFVQINRKKLSKKGKLIRKNNFACLPFVEGRNIKLENLLKQIQALDWIKFTDLLTFLVRPMIEISVTSYLTQVFRYTKTRLKEMDLKSKVKLVVEDLTQKDVVLHNKQQINSFKNEFSDIIELNNADIHDTNYSSLHSEVVKMLKRTDALLEEVWKQISELVPNSPLTV